MLYKPKTLKEAKEFRYGVCASNPNGDCFHPMRCAAEVSDGTKFFQCRGHDGYGPNGLYCKVCAGLIKKEQH